MKSTSSTKRFMAPSGGPIAGSSSAAQQQPANPTGTFNQGILGANTRVSLSHGRQQPHLQQSTLPSRYLVTVLPPEQLPHDPPHPRTSTFCSGYGPPSKFRRGTLIPLHSTLAGQMAAIAREYGLPSTGGIALYLVELNQEQHNPLSDALVGGPRIGDEAWQLLWGQLFAPLQDDCMEASLSEEDEPYFDQYAPARHDTSVPVMPPLPPSMRPSQPAYGPQESSSLHHTNDNRPASPSEHQSDVSSLVDNSSALASEDHLGQQSMVSSNASHIFSSGSLSTRQPKSSNTSFNQEHDSSMPSSPHGRPYSSASRGRPRNHPRSQFRTASSANLRSNASRHSIRSNRSYSQSNTSLDGPLYGEAVVVGKIEFDIDNRRGAGKWFDAWMQSANAQSSGASSPVEPVQTISKPTLSRPRPSHSSSGSLLYGRNRISELGLPDATQQESSESAPPHEVHPSEHVRSMGDEGKLSADNEVEPQPESNQGGSVRDSIASSMHSSQGPLPASAIQVASPQDTKPEYIFSLDNANPRLSADSAVLTGSKRSSQASQASLLSPSQVPISQRSSGDVASWQTDPSKSGDESHQFISERSSSSSFGHEANIEAMNATPRVRAAPAFQTRPMSCTPSSPSGSVISHERSVSELSTTSSTKESSHRMSAQSDVAANLPSLPSQSAFSDDGLPSRRHSNASSVYDDQHRASGISQVSNDEDQAELELDHHSESVRASQNSSRASSHSRHSSSSVDAVSIDQHQYQALADDEPETYITLSSSNSQSGHETELAMAAPFTTVIPETQGAAESQYGASEVEDTRSAVGEIESEVDITKGDPLRDMFPSDANTWAQIKYSHDPEDSATDSPAEELVQTALGLGISSSSMLNSHAIPPSASSSLDPFEYDDETGDALNSPVGPLEDDVKEVTDMLKANSAPVHFGLSSPINLGEPSKRLSRQSQASMPDKVVEANAVSISSDLTRSRAASRSSVARSMKSSLGSALSSPNSALSPVDPATIALPESNSNSSLSTLAPSASSKSLASAASQPSIWEPENTMTEAPKMTNRDARLPVDWADQLSAMGTLRSRGNSVTTDGDGDVSEETGLPMPVGELPQFMSQLGEATQSRASLASLYAQSARSRSSSVEMMDNLDEIERALAELSPRALKSTLGDDAVCDPCSKVCFHKLTCCLSQGAPNLTTFLQQAGALATMPGYAKDSIEEQLAPITPRAAPFDVASDDALATTSTESQASLRSEPRPSTDEDAHDQTIIASSQSFKSLESYNSGYMAPPLPLKIRTGRSEPGSPSPASDRSGPTPLATSVDLPQVGTPTTEAPMEESIISPGGQSRASTTIPYDAPSVHDSPQQRVTFAPDPQEASEQLSTPTAKSGMSSKFAAGLKLKSWSGKSSQKELSPSPSPQSKDSSNSGNHTKEPAKSPLPGLKGFKWWQKEGASLSEDSVQKTATEISLPASPSTSQQGDHPSILKQPNPPFSQTARIPRKSSLASLAATARSQDSLSPNLHNVHGMPLPSTSPLSATSPHFGAEYPSPPTHTSLPSPPRRPVRLPSFMPSYPPQFVVDDEERGQATPPLMRNDSGTTQSTSPGTSPQIAPPSFMMSSSSMVASASLPVLSDSTSQTRSDFPAYLQRTPEMGSNSHGTFLGHEGRSDGHTTSAPVTPASAIPSLVPSSGRYGRPSKANPVKANFRLSADSDLSKMMKHMQAIEFGEEAAQTSFASQPPEQGHHHPARASPARGNFGLGLGLPGARKVFR